jgi:hypothetical protein
MIRLPSQRYEEAIGIGKKALGVRSAGSMFHSAGHSRLDVPSSRAARVFLR